MHRVHVVFEYLEFFDKDCAIHSSQAEPLSIAKSNGVLRSVINGEASRAFRTRHLVDSPDTGVRAKIDRPAAAQRTFKKPHPVEQSRTPSWQGNRFEPRWDLSPDRFALEPFGEPVHYANASCRRPGIRVGTIATKNKWRSSTTQSVAMIPL